MAAAQRPAGTPFRRSLLNPAALGYLAVVAAVWVWIGVDTLLVDHADASLAGVWGFLVTAPTSFLFAALPGPLPLIGVAVGALVQALALGAAYRRLAGRTRGEGDAGARHA
ncbi:SCO4225 family membrane protein [Streptomyces sp. NPDC058374]|uniref:SCO4225 family membrane protein n=1 Tax=unclassified Streptomyces TaxID=2593676 RepID=UPI0036475628